ncbi:CotH kinase family protein [Dactylosporangium cerinum]|uniref:CotH kinase family protein n=1 Tax=Dactylosporangium cerinum TaxID=1434730 RepID=A0ABV9WMF0_9ACTN
MHPRLPQRLLHRIPVRIRHYWKLLAVCAAFLVACAVVFSTVRVAPLVTSASDNNGDQVTQDVAGSTDLFDATRAHKVTLTFKDADYQRLLDEFWDEGEKEFLEADITIDGTRLDSVGIRLKGNSTLSGLTRNGQSRPGGFGGGRGGQLPQRNGNGGFPGGGQGALPGGDQQGGFRPGGGFGMSSLKAEEPETLPWLIRFDEFADGRRYQGHREIAVRVAGMGGGSTVLNEAVSLNVLAAADQTAQRYAYTSFTVNDRPTTARLIVEHPDEDFADTLGGSGVLYKSLATGSFTDQGDDPTDYADDFKQITKKGSQDLQPVIDLIQWVNGAGDADFDKHLAEHVDVPSFANYVAVQNLLLNSDDMAGPGRNYYLWYNLKTKRFSVVGWDYNLSFSGSATTGPHDTTSMGGGRFPGGGNAGANGGALPQDFQPPAGMQLPGGGRGFGGMGGNKLKERFLASTAFKATYDDAYRKLYKKIYAGADALNILDGITKVLGTVEGNNADKTRSDADQLRNLIVQRTEHLAGDAVITDG